ncbi:MAG: hypothetical protein JRF28_09890 [Deltaproteobacteria bacterium]|nr:hypothetical protein [Deltaproteobacteria bacterium]
MQIEFTKNKLGKILMEARSHLKESAPLSKIILDVTGYHLKGRLIKKLSEVSKMFRSPLHGIDHWKRVEKNGLNLSQFTNADTDIVTCFAYLHDCMRMNENRDLEHGKRGAEYARKLRSDIIDLTDDQFEILFFACEWHTKGKHTDNITIATCWDADRLDLGRVGIIPSEKYLLTNEAKRIANKLDPYSS